MSKAQVGTWLANHPGMLAALFAASAAWTVYCAFQCGMRANAIRSYIAQTASEGMGG